MSAVITAFIRSKWGATGDVGVAAVDEDGFILATHVSSSTTWAECDIGVSDVAGRASWKDDLYNSRYPDGWVVEWTEDRERLDALYKRSLSVDTGGDS